MSLVAHAKSGRKYETTPSGASAWHGHIFESYSNDYHPGLWQPIRVSKNV
jgi:hypothetical protein